MYGIIYTIHAPLCSIHFLISLIDKRRFFSSVLQSDFFIYFCLGEFLGIVEAVRYVMEHPESPRTIYSDSITAITWYRNKQTASSRRCPALQKAEIFLKVMEARIKDIEVLHWDNRLWGEIPADFGNK